MQTELLRMRQQRSSEPDLTETEQPKSKNVKLYFECIFAQKGYKRGKTCFRIWIINLTKQNAGIELDGGGGGGDDDGGGFDLGDAEATRITNAELSEHG